MNNQTIGGAIPPPRLRESLGAVAREVLGEQIDGLQFKRHGTEPRKRDAFLVYANGTTWDPGSGAGLYIYKTGTGWVFVA